MPALLPGVSVCLDWLRMVGKSDRTGALRLWALHRWGTGEPTSRQFYAHAERFGPGVVVAWEHNQNGGCYIDFSGSVLADMPPEDRLQVARELHELGLEGSRVDLAGDLIEQGLDVIGCAERSCEAGELTGARRYQPTREVSSGSLIGRTLYLGCRGKLGSGRFGRAYDKGLETKTAPAGVWERFEVEFTGETAAGVLAALVCADDWEVEAKAHLFGAFDFREKAGASRSLDRRERCAWWQRVLDLFGDALARVRIPRRLPDLQRFARWMGRAVLPSVQALADAAGRSIDDLCAALVGPDVAHSRNSGVLIAQYRSLMRDGPALAIGPPR